MIEKCYGLDIIGNRIMDGTAKTWTDWKYREEQREYEEDE